MSGIHKTSQQERDKNNKLLKSEREKELKNLEKSDKEQAKKIAQEKLAFHRNQLLKSISDPKNVIPLLIVLVIIIGIFITIPSIIINFYNSNDNDILPTSADYDLYPEHKYINKTSFTVAVTTLSITFVCILVSCILIILTMYGYMHRYFIYVFIVLCISANLVQTLMLSIIIHTLIKLKKFPDSYYSIWILFPLEIIILVIFLTIINQLV
jgi:magnesium-transporting ATPase (P-type)